MGADSGRRSESGTGGGTSSQQSSYFARLLMTAWSGRQGKPMTVAELLMTAGEAFESLFHEPPIGPIPDYLDPHWGVHGCVAEYEERLEELDRWKALELSRWLEDRVGSRWCVDGRVYELRAEAKEDAAAKQFCVGLFEDGIESGERLPRKSQGK